MIRLDLQPKDSSDYKLDVKDIFLHSCYRLSNTSHSVSADLHEDNRWSTTLRNRTFPLFILE